MVSAKGSCLGPLLFLMYINDLPQASKFKTTLFADDTYLCLSDTNLNNLQIRVNAELQNINFWLRKNTLSLNYNKTNFMLINKHPHKTVECDFNLSINDLGLSRTDSVKYLGVYLDDNLNWTPHVKHLSLLLARYSGLFYRIRNLVLKYILLMLFYSVVYSRVQHGIILWGSTFKPVLRELEVRLNNIVRTITGSRKFDHVTPLFKQLKLLKLHDIYQLELEKFMYQLNWNKLPIIIQSLFTKIEYLHKYNTRQAKTTTVNYSYQEYLNKWRKLNYRLKGPTLVVVVVVAHIYPPATGQRQTLSCWTIRTLFITRTTL